MNILNSIQSALRLLLAGAGAAAAVAAGGAPSGAGLLRPQDVVALVGGEDMVAAWDHGLLEYLVLRQKPDLQARFRSLTKEGDTAFQQTRDFNYPALEKQLADIGATVVVVQIGQMESLRGKAQVAEFERAAEALVDRLGDGRKRRVILVGPTPVPAGTPVAARFAALDAYREAVARVANRKELPCIVPGERRAFAGADYRDGLHLNERGHFTFAAELADALVGRAERQPPAAPAERRLLELIRSKNQRWFNYVRPENWAFLDGDRTVQPASRDHVDPEKRWFPEEIKQWLPLVAEREREAWTVARQLRAP
jgi:lysophospholipase L1-like esterase